MGKTNYETLLSISMAFFDDIISNREKTQDGKYVLYSKEEREKYLCVLEMQKKIVDNEKTGLSFNEKALITSIYDLLIKNLNDNTI